MNRPQRIPRGPARNNILVMAIILLLVSQHVAAAGASVTWERFLSGKWLLRPLQSQNFFQPYTHSATFVPARNLDGEVTAQFVPYHGVDNASSWLTTMLEQVAVTLRPITDSTRYYASLLWTPLGRRKQESGDPLTRRVDPWHPSLSADSCSMLPVGASSDVLDALRNTSWTLTCFAQGSVGTVTLSWSSLDGGCAGDGEQPRSREFPVTLNQQVNDYFKYRTMSTTGAHAIPLTPIAVPLSAAADSGGNPTPCFRMQLGIASASVQFVDDASGIVTVVWRSLSYPETSTSDEGSPTVQGGPRKCLVQYVLKRITDTDEDRSVKSMTATLAFLVVVALMKFGPRWYMRWKGVNPNSLLGRKRVNAAAPHTNPLSGLRQQAEILQSVRKAQKS